MTEPTKIPWNRIAVEALAIVGSILLAFAIDTWWEERQTLEVETNILAAVSKEIEENLSMLQTSIEDSERRQATADAFIAISNKVDTDLSEDEIVSIMISMQAASTYKPSLGASTMLLQTPVTNSKALEARSLINSWFQILTDAEEERQAVRRYVEKVLELQSPYAARENSGNRSSVSRMAAKAGPDVLLELRANQELVQAVLLKNHWQSRYIANLQPGIEIMENLIELLNQEI